MFCNDACGRNNSSHVRELESAAYANGRPCNAFKKWKNLSERHVSKNYFKLCERHFSTDVVFDYILFKCFQRILVLNDIEKSPWILLYLFWFYRIYYMELFISYH